MLLPDCALPLSISRKICKALNFWHASCQIWANVDVYPASVEGWNPAPIFAQHGHIGTSARPFQCCFFGALGGARFCRFNFFFCSMGSTPSMVKKECEGFSHPALQLMHSSFSFHPPYRHMLLKCVYIYVTYVHMYVYMYIYIYICVFFGSFTYAHIYLYIYSCDSNGFNYWTVFFNPFKFPSSYVTWWVTSKEGAQSIPWIKTSSCPLNSQFLDIMFGHMFVSYILFYTSPRIIPYVSPQKKVWFILGNYHHKIVYVKPIPWI